MQATVLQHKRGARHVGRDQSMAQIERFTQSDRRRLLRQDRVGTRLDRKAIHVFGANDAAQSRRGFEELKGNAANRQFVGRGQSGDAAANDCDHSLIISWRLATGGWRLVSPPTSWKSVATI